MRGGSRDHTRDICFSCSSTVCVMRPRGTENIHPHASRVSERMNGTRSKIFLTKNIIAQLSVRVSRLCGNLVLVAYLHVPLEQRNVCCLLGNCFIIGLERFPLLQN